MKKERPRNRLRGLGLSSGTALAVLLGQPVFGAPGAQLLAGAEPGGRGDLPVRAPRDARGGTAGRLVDHMPPPVLNYST